MIDFDDPKPTLKNLCIFPPTQPSSKQDELTDTGQHALLDWHKKLNRNTNKGFNKAKDNQPFRSFISH
jgi:hypothetical protein